MRGGVEGSHKRGSSAAGTAERGDSRGLGRVVRVRVMCGHDGQGGGPGRGFPLGVPHARRRGRRTTSTHLKGE